MVPCDAQAPEAAPVAPKLEATGPAEDAVPVAASAATAGGTGSTVAVQVTHCSASASHASCNSTCLFTI